MEQKIVAALLLGTFTKQTDQIKKYFALTQNAKVFDLNLKGALTRYLLADGPFQEGNKVKIFHFDDPTVLHYVRKYHLVAVVNLGPLDVPEGLEHTDIKIKNIMNSIVFAIRELRKKYINTIHIDSCDHPKIVGTAVALTVPLIKPKYISDSTISVDLFNEFNLSGESEYDVGTFLGEGQRLAQLLMKSSSVSEFVKTVKSFFREFNVKFEVRTDLWMRKKKMNSLLSTAKSADQRPLMLEIIWKNSHEGTKPLILVGKATPYENSLFPLCDKPEFQKFEYRSGMGGASSIIGSLYSLCKLIAPVHVHCIIAVVWNQLHDKPNKIEDVVCAMDGTSIQIDRPEAEGRLIMADVLCYANTLDSSAIMDVTTLSSNIDALIGNSYIGFFTSDENLKRTLYKASQSSGEKIWQLPLYKCFQDLLKTSEDANISNVGLNEKSVTTLKSASFLQEFVKGTKPWIHLDITAVSESRGKYLYLNDWATGRPTRLLAEFCIEFFKEK